MFKRFDAWYAVKWTTGTIPSVAIQFPHKPYRSGLFRDFGGDAKDTCQR